jgi:hypothetical protein
MIVLATNALINVTVVNLQLDVKNVLHPLFACLHPLAFAKMATLMMETQRVVNAIINVLPAKVQLQLALLVTPLYLENWLELLALVERDGIIQAQIQFVKNVYINVRLVWMEFLVLNVLRILSETLNLIVCVKKNILIMESLYVYLVLIIVRLVSKKLNVKLVD